MLMDVSKRRRIRSVYDRNRYDSERLRELVSWNKHDGLTNAAGVACVRRLNEYIEESRYLLIKFWVLFMILRDIREGRYEDDPGCGDLFKAYAAYLAPNVGSAMSNVVRSAKSITAQRKLFIQVKWVLKQNKLSKDWYDLVMDQCTGLEKRIRYLSDVTLPANIQGTPLELYMQVLEQEGVSVDRDIEYYVSSDVVIFEDFTGDEQLQAYKDHVIKVLSEHNGDASMHGLYENAMTRLRTLDERRRAREAEAEAEQTASEKKMFEDGREYVFAMCSQITDDVSRMRPTSIERHKAHGTRLFFVPAAVVRNGKVRTGYLRTDNGRPCVCRLRYARAFSDAESANGFAKDAMNANPMLYAASAEVLF